MDYKSLLNDVTYVAIKIIDLFNHPNVIQNIISFLNILFERSKFENPEILLNLLKNKSFYSLMENNDESIKTGLCDLFKNMIVTIPENSYSLEIYSSVLTFLEISLKNKFHSSVLSLWLLFSKDYTVGINEMDLKMKQLIQV